MAKETKDLEKEEKKVTTKKSSSAKKKTTAKKDTTSKKTTVTSKTTTSKKAATKKATTSKASTTAKKKTASTKKTSAKKSASTKKVEKKVFQNEYYDLPYSYNKTIVTVLAQTPKTLFVYWEISEQDRKNFIKNYGESFFEQTKPILIVYNNTMQYSFEIDINDFANSWYIHINDSNCDYSVELGRRPLPFANHNRNQEYRENQSYIPYYVYVSSSNDIVAPNNRTLFDFYKSHPFVTFRNVKTGEIINKDINQFKFITNLGIMTIKELYKHLYPDENFEYENFIGNPSSGLTSSGTFSSKFK